MKTRDSNRHAARDRSGHFTRKQERKKEMLASVTSSAEDPAASGEPQPARRRGRPPGSKTRRPDGMQPSDLQALLGSAHKGALEVTATILKRDTSGGELDGPSKALGELSAKALASKMEGDELDTSTALWIYGAVAVLTVVSIFSLPRKEQHEPGTKDQGASTSAGGTDGIAPTPGNA